MDDFFGDTIVDMTGRGVALSKTVQGIWYFSKRLHRPSKVLAVLKAGYK
jgi:hypothetical protein